MGTETKTAQTVLSQSLFNTVYVPARTWRSYFTSTLLHFAVILTLLLIAVPVIKKEIKERRSGSVTIIAPVIPQYQTKVVPPRHVEYRRTVAIHDLKPRILTPIKVVPIEPAVQIRRPAAPAPEIKIASSVPVQSLPDLKPAPAAPRLQVQTGTFQAIDRAKSQVSPKVLQVGGFGDPRGVQASPDARPSTTAIPQIGSFDQPAGGGRAGGGGQSTAGGVRQTSFGGAGESGGTTGGTGHSGGPVRTGAFGENAPAAQMASTAHPQTVEPVFTPVEILFKPRPTYTEEARHLRLEGQVSLDVMFLSNGSIRVLRVVHGLGHGLDEAAQQAALQVRFRPAMRAGVPVDTSATIHITFQLT